MSFTPSFHNLYPKLCVMTFTPSSHQCCSCLFVSGRTVVYCSHYKRPQFLPKVDFGGPNYWLQTFHVVSHVDWPTRTMLTVRPARQDAVLLRSIAIAGLE